MIADEFQNFVTSSFASALSEVRKYRLSLLLAHQYQKQVREDIRDAVFGNVGSIISFRVGNDTAALLESELAPDVSAAQLLNLGVTRSMLASRKMDYPVCRLPAGPCDPHPGGMLSVTRLSLPHVLGMLYRDTLWKTRYSGLCHAQTRREGG